MENVVSPETQAFYIIHCPLSIVHSLKQVPISRRVPNSYSIPIIHQNVAIEKTYFLLLKIS